MNPFDRTPPEWTKKAVHALEFFCPTCRQSSLAAEQVWMNRRSPVYGHDRQRKWQEFYHCQCGCDWWAWSSDRPPNEFADREPLNEPDNFFGYF
ncbi:hypothetical protein IQ266_20670 [filamentous cyanobacterium LEGE 11480]|uniref:Uncharacterized protein n=1 Tax=Romeriopsis navalis LEGE 11480 TaxID=2777977 RepID=A0A928VSG5_9CYAN|nr:hypothetical protein [Romeriopsis navalis]MBE9032156.1 hypothetical protein [Romeriopsis navalis LEGE 11480]